jgi:hypothetical protein
LISALITSVLTALRRARLAILTIAGTVMVHTGTAFALSYRDRLVNQATQQDPAAAAARQGDNLRAALWDFAGNLGLGSVPKAISGFSVIFPYPFVAYQGWIGGIVSVRGDHTSRLNDPRSAIYYLLTLILQIIPYSLAIGAGVNVGLAAYRPSPDYPGEKWFGSFPKEAVWDMARIYSLVIPLFLVASLWEFLSPWNI